MHPAALTAITARPLLREAPMPHGDDTSPDGAARELNAQETKAIQDEHVRKANEDPAWLNKHYYEYDDPGVGRRDGHLKVLGRWSTRLVLEEVCRRPSAWSNATVGEAMSYRTRGKWQPKAFPNGLEATGQFRGWHAAEGYSLFGIEHGFRGADVSGGGFTGS
ncbi:hypothetical protein ACWGNF_33135 [Streptomyces sp. NPDC055808]